MLPPQVVFDTSSIVIPILRPDSANAWVRESWERNRTIPIATHETISELLTVLQQPRFSISSEQAKALTSRYASHCRILTPMPKPSAPRCRDLDDQKFIDLAYRAHADYLVSIDPDLLALEDISKVPIIRPTELYTRLSQAGEH